MKLVASFLLLLTFALFGVTESRTQQTGGAVSKINALESKWNDAYKHGDPGGMSDLLAEDFIITVEDGATFSKSGYLAHTADSDLRVQISDMSDLRVRVHDNLAIVTGAYHEKGTSKGKPYENHDRFTDVWIKNATGWHVLASHYATPSTE